MTPGAPAAGCSQAVPRAVRTAAYAGTRRIGPSTAALMQHVHLPSPIQLFPRLGPGQSARVTTTRHRIRLTRANHAIAGGRSTAVSSRAIERPVKAGPIAGHRGPRLRRRPEQEAPPPVRQRASARVRAFQARYLGPDGLMPTAPHTVDSKQAADKWLTLTEAEILRGDWLDPLVGESTCPR